MRKGIFVFLFVFACLSARAQEVGSAHSFDYEQIREHPRLLLGKGEENSVKASLAKKPELTKIDKYIHQVSDGLINEEPLVFEKRGKRLLAVSRQALTRLYYLSYSYRVSKDEKYLQRAERELHALCDFESWNPSHFLDVGEMCMAVAIAYDWLYDDLQIGTKEKVRKAILEKAFAPSYNEKDAWFLRAHNNWNSVCNAGLVFGALAIFEDAKEQSIAIIERALQTNLLALQAYGPDGNYPEGPGYWNYGTSFQVMMFAALESALGSDKGLARTPGFMESADYMLFATGPSGWYFNYSDNGRSVSASPSMFWFAKKRNDPALVYQEKSLIQSGAYTKKQSSDEERMLPNVLIFGKDLNLSGIKPPGKQMFTGHGITPVSIVRTAWEAGQGRYLGIKGGKASAPHGHMDQGTFVYDVGGLRWAMDFGLQSYLTLESKGVDLWNMSQNSQRWDIFRYNNLNHNTLTINNKRHNVDGKAEIIETFDRKKEKGAKIDLTPVLNLNNEVKAANRKAVIVDDSYLKIEDFVQANSNPVSLRWNMVTPALAEIVDKSTIKLSQKGKTMFLKFSADIPFNLVIRPSENPSQYTCEFGDYKYGTYNQQNRGIVMVGFDAEIPANKAGQFTVTFQEGKSDLVLKNNTFVLDAPNPNTASHGFKLFHDISPIGIDPSGALYPLDTPDWVPYGEVTNKNLFGKAFKFRIDAKRIDPSGIVNAGIDRSGHGQLGVKGGESPGINKNEGYFLSLDLSDIAPSVTIELTKIAFTYLGDSESCTIVNRQVPGKMLVFKGNDKKRIEEVKITANHSRQFVNVSDLGIVLKGGENHAEFLSFFNTSESGDFRVAGFEFVVK
ncbi:heparinase II/III family protein [Parapedobacter sp. SGR-10]|uniref:heparinase II/III domain-containing protein n=1 Tax=Parapedobacter sp. SGR-10 TaxID=2710879 RepID=UPI00197E9EEC|nr:heparinase II/III family protein [Parapedobacter sp. SGR-10]